MTRLRSFGLAAAVLLLALAGAGCAAQLAYRQGKEAAAERDWDLAVARYTRALDKDQDNIGYKIALETARVQASRMHYDEAKKQLAANDLDKAVEELEIASRYDPANRSASDDLAIVRHRIEVREQEKRERAGLDQLKARAQATARVPVPVLSPRSPVPITMRFEDGSLQKIFESLGRIAGVNVLFDEGFRDKKASVNLTGVTFEEALDRLTFVNRLFYKVVDQNTLIIVPESRQKRVAYDELLLRTFYVQNAEINDTVNLVKTLAKVTTVGPNPSLGAITVLGTVDQIAMAERIIEGERQGARRGGRRGADPGAEPHADPGVGHRPLQLLGGGDAVAHRCEGRGRGRASEHPGLPPVVAQPGGLGGQLSPRRSWPSSRRATTSRASWPRPGCGPRKGRRPS